MSKHRAHRADDKRRPGMGDNQKFKVTGKDTNGAGPALSDIFNDRRKPNGHGKRSV